MSFYTANLLTAAAELLEKAYGASQAERVAELKAAATYENEKARKECETAREKNAIADLIELCTSKDITTLRDMCKPFSDVRDVLDSIIEAGKKADQ